MQEMIFMQTTRLLAKEFRLLRIDPKAIRTPCNAKGTGNSNVRKMSRINCFFHLTKTNWHFCTRTIKAQSTVVWNIKQTFQCEAWIIYQLFMCFGLSSLGYLGAPCRVPYLVPKPSLFATSFFSIHEHSFISIQLNESMFKYQRLV